MSTLAVLTTLFGIVISRLNREQLRELKSHDAYFIHPKLARDYNVPKEHAYGNHWYGSITNILNSVSQYGSFELSPIQETYQDGQSHSYNVPVFVQKSQLTEHIERDSGVGGVLTHTATIEYHCYHHDDTEHVLVDFYHHTQPTPHHNGETIFKLRGCMMRIKFGWPGARAVDLHSDKLQYVYIRKADKRNKIWYLSNRNNVAIRPYEFWRSHSKMFENSRYFDHSLVFNPIAWVRIQSTDLCNDQQVMNHPGIILVDDNWHNGGYLQEHCLRNIHLENIKKQWLSTWKLVEPLGLNLRAAFIGNELPNINSGGGSPPTLIESSVEVIQRTQGAGEIKWKQGQISGGYMREYEIESIGSDCVCDEASLGSQCSGLCTKKLYLLPSVHDQVFSAENLKRLVEGQRIEYLVTELDTERFKGHWNHGDYSQHPSEVWTACKLAINPNNDYIKKIVLADLEAYHMYSGGRRHYHLFRPQYNDIYPIWTDYYDDLFLHIRNHALVKTLNGMVSEMQQTEKVAFPVGMAHYNPVDRFVVDIQFPVGPDDPSSNTQEAQLNRMRIAAKSDYLKMHRFFSEYFGGGMQDLLLNPSKVRNVYTFQLYNRHRNEFVWTTAQDRFWN